MAKQKLDSETNTLTVEVPTRQYPSANSICIRPYIDDDAENMGLQKYKMVVHQGVTHTEFLSCKDINGIKRYITGLNEYAPEVQEIPDKEKRAAVIRDIRMTVAELEKEFTAKIVNVEDPEFWNKITQCHPNNHSWWGQFFISCGNDPVYLDPKHNPHDRIKLYAIEAGGFSMVAKSFEAARHSANPPKFYLDKAIETASSKTEVKLLKNRAISTLTDLYTKNPEILMYIIKIIHPSPAQYKRSTPSVIIYDELDKYINGETVEKNSKRASQEFLDAASMNPEERKIRCVIRDCAFYKYITVGSDGMFRHVTTGSIMGRNVAEVIEYLRNPMNDVIYLDLMKQFENHIAE